MPMKRYGINLTKLKDSQLENIVRALNVPTDEFDWELKGVTSWGLARKAVNRAVAAIEAAERLGTVTTFIPPSEETLAWGGFMGGDYVHNTPSFKDQVSAAIEVS